MFKKAENPSTRVRGRNNNIIVIGTLNGLNIHLKTPCEDVYPSLDMDEECRVVFICL